MDLSVIYNQASWLSDFHTLFALKEKAAQILVWPERHPRAKETARACLGELGNCEKNKNEAKSI